MPKYESQSDVIRAIKKASDAELRALADISRLLRSMGGNGGLRYVKAANAGKYRQPRSNEIGRALESALGAQTGTNTGGGRARRRHNISTIPAQVSLSTVRKSRQIVQKAVNDTIESAAEAIVESLESDIKAQIGTKAARRKPVKRTPTSPAPAGHYYDDNGRLRDSTGRYASKAANEKARRTSSTDKESAETNGLLKKMLTGMGKGASGIAREGSGDLGANAAGMGVMWQASKELAGVVKGAGKNTVDMAKFINDGRKAMSRPIKRGFSANDTRASVRENQEIKAEEAAKAQHKDAVDTHSNQEREIALLQEIAHKIGSGEGGGGNGGGFMSTIGKVLGGGLGLGLLKRGFSSIRSRLPGGKGRARGAGGIGDELDEAGNLKRAGKASGKAAGKAAAEIGEQGAEKLAKGSLVKGGEGLLEKGALKAAGKIGLRAIPIIGTLASAGIDAYQGWNDDETLHSTFGANAGNKERFAQATANVADLGGLISGTSNLISGVLDDLGFSSASAAFQMNGSTGLAKKIDSLIGGSEEDADKRNESLLDKLSEIVTGVKALAPGVAQGLSVQALQALNDNAKLTGSALTMATSTAYDANGDLNKERKAKGFSFNPQAQITLQGDTRGIAMNNPTNLNFANQPGAMKEVGGKDNRFAAFATPEEGIRAAGNNLLRYKSKGVVKLRDILMKWAPPSENDTAKYISTVAKTMGPGYSGDTVIDANDPAVTAKLISAFSAYENSGFNMSGGDVSTALGTVQDGKYVGGWTDATKNALSKTDAGKAILANNMGNAAPSVAAGGKTPTATGIPVNPAAPPPGNKDFFQTVAGWVKAGSNAVNGAANAVVPGLKYSNAKAGIGLGAITRTQIKPMLNGDALVNAAPHNTLPTPATLSQGGGLLSDVFNQATQAISGQTIMSGLTHNMAPGWQYALNPLTTAAGNGIDSVLNLGRSAVGGWLNGSSATQRTVTDLSGSGARLTPDSSVTKAQEAQQSTLEEIASYLEQILGIQKKPSGSADKAKAGPEPGPSGDIPLASNSSVINTIIKRNQS